MMDDQHPSQFPPGIAGAYLRNSRAFHEAPTRHLIWLSGAIAGEVVGGNSWLGLGRNRIGDGLTLIKLEIQRDFKPKLLRFGPVFSWQYVIEWIDVNDDRIFLGPTCGVMFTGAYNDPSIHWPHMLQNGDTLTIAARQLPIKGGRKQ